MSQGKIETEEIEAVSDGGSDVLEPDAGPDLETDNQGSSDDEEQENASMDVDEAPNNTNEENKEEEEEESEEEENKFIPMDVKGPITVSDIASEDVELWLLKVPQNFEVGKFIGTKHLRFHKVPHTDGELATVALTTGDDKERDYSIVSADPIEFQTLVNVFPGKDNNKKRRLLLGKPFSKMLTFVEKIEAKIEKKQSEADSLRRQAPVQPEKLYVRYVPPGAKRPEEVPNPILKRKRESENDTPNKKAKTSGSARDTPSKSSGASEGGVFKTPEPVARKKSSSNMKDGSTQSTNTSPTKTIESTSDKKDKASESAKKDKKDKKDKSSKDKMDVDESPKKKDNKSEDNTPTSSPTKKDKKRKHKSDKKDK